MTAISAKRAISRIVVPATREQGGGVRATGRWQDKSREARPGRLAGKRATINSLARCATTHDSLPLLTSH
jgi:hypothetical protein